jgi:hypothetical protein
MSLPAVLNQHTDRVACLFQRCIPIPFFPESVSMLSKFRLAQVLLAAPVVMTGCDTTSAVNAPAPTPAVPMTRPAINARPVGETGNTLSVAQPSGAAPVLVPAVTPVPAAPAPVSAPVPPLAAPPARSY